MLLPLAKQLALDLMAQHGLSEWTFRITHSLTRFGQCSYRKKQITLSKHLTEMNDEALVRNTILHEIAHALAGHKAAHGPAWRAQALAIGCDGRRTYDDSVAAPPRNTIGVCPGCLREIRRHRRRALHCIACHSAGRPSRIKWI